MNRRLTTARRTVERLQLEAGGAGKPEVAIWEAQNRVADLVEGEQHKAVRTARRAGLVMDLVLLVVAGLTMSFSFGNIHAFALGHEVADPIAFFLAPAVDLALLAAILGDAVLSRWQLGAGAWATRLRWYAGGATVVLNSWQAWASLDPAAIVLHLVPPTLLFVLAEAAIPYRRQFTGTVHLAAQQAAAGPVAVEETPVAVEVEEVDTAAVSPVTSQVITPEPAPVPVVDTEGDTVPLSTPVEVEPEHVHGDAVADALPRPRLDTEAAKAAIEAAWVKGLTVREAAENATRSTSYVGRVYGELDQIRGPRPTAGQLSLVKEA